MNVPEPMVFVVDDDPAVLKAVSRVLRSAGMNVSPFGDAQEFLVGRNPAAHGCVILDVEMPGLSGLDVQDRLAADGTGPPILFLTGRADVPRTVRAMKHGAVDFLTKPVDDEALIAAVRAAIEKDRATWRDRSAVLEIQRRLETLTPREREVMERVVAGKLNKQTAAELGSAERTVKIHRARVMEKMGAESLAELIQMAERAGLTPSHRDPGA